MEKTNEHIVIKALRSGFEMKDKQNKRYYFSIYVVLPGDENNKGLPVIEYGTGVDQFDESIEKALSFDPVKIIVVDQKTKTEKRRSSNEHPIELMPKKEENENELQGILEEKLHNGLEEIRQSISTSDDSQDNGLGLIIEKSQHQGEKLRWEMEKQMNELKHQKKIEDLQRRIAELEEQHAEDEQTMDEMEEANKEWERTYTDLKNNRLKFNGVDGKELIGELIGKGLSGFVRQNIGAVAKLSGMPQEVLSDALNNASTQPATGGKSQITEEDTDPQLEALMQQIRTIIKGMDQAYIQPFIKVIASIAEDNSIVLKLVDEI